MMDFSNKVFACVDYGLFQPLAHRIARDVGKVYYCRQSRRGHPLASDKSPGSGYDDIVLSDGWIDIIDEVDCWVFPDIFDGDIQRHLASLGKRVFGGRNADELEIYRGDFRKLMKGLELPVAKYELVNGVEALREALKDATDKYIKTWSTIRGTSETWHHIRYNLSLSKLDQISHSLGSLRDAQEFLIDDPIRDVTEIGYDDMCILGQFADHCLVGIEHKDRAYFGKFVAYADLPEDLQKTNEALASILEKHDFRGFWSTELRGKYLIDPCPRLASPAGESIQEMSLNLVERIWAGAEGEVVDPQPAGQYAAQVMIVSDEVENNPLSIDVPEEHRQWVKLYNSSIDDHGQEWISPSPNKMSELGSVVGIGDTPEEAKSACINHCEDIQCLGLEIHSDELEDAIKEGVEALD